MGRGMLLGVLAHGPSLTLGKEVGGCLGATLAVRPYFVLVDEEVEE